MWHFPSSAAVFAPVVLRAVYGVIFLAHGSQKLFGAFDGHKVGGTAQFLESVGLKPGLFWAVLLTTVEFVGGLAVLIGLWTRGAAAAIAISQVVAIVLVHAKNGFFNQKGGFEYNLTLIAVGVALFLTGSGPVSVDWLLGK